MTDFSVLSQAAAGANTRSPDQNAASRTSLGSNFDTFLQLLTAQIQNQDPLSPMDATQFTEQLVQFSQVEQQIRMNEQMGALVTATRTGQSAGALTYLGRTVDLNSNVAGLSEPGADAAWTLSFPAPALRALVRVMDSSGRVVNETPLDRPSGQVPFQWDGLTSLGQPAPAGLYRLSVTAVDSGGDPIRPQITVSEPVTGVSFDSNGAPVFITPGGTRSFDQIRTIREGP